MQYWPISTICSSPLLHPSLADEVRQIERGALTQGALYACGQVARHTMPTEAPRLVTVETVGGPSRHVFLGYPEWDEWFRLERAGMEVQDGMIVLMVDALH